jgi:hypothetical protein
MYANIANLVSFANLFLIVLLAILLSVFVISTLQISKVFYPSPIISLNL